MTWMIRDGGVWREAHAVLPGVIDGVRHGRAILTLWPDADLLALGLRRLTVDEPPEGERATGWETVDVDGAPVQRPTATEPIPDPPPPVLTPWQWETLMDVVPGLRAGVEAATADPTDDPEIIALRHRIRRGNSYHWGDFATLAALIATPEQIAEIEGHWRAVARMAS